MTVIMALGLIPVTALPVLAADPAVAVSGEVNASGLPDNAVITLNGNTTINLDGIKTISSINSGSFSVTIKGTGMLNVKKSLQASLVNIDGNVSVEGDKVGIMGIYGINFLSGNTSVKAKNTAVFSSGTLFVAKGASVRAESWSEGSATVYSKDDMEICGSLTADVSGGKSYNQTIWTNGNLNVSGNVSASSESINGISVAKNLFLGS